MFTAGVASGFCVDEGLTLMSRCGAVNAGFYGDRVADASVGCRVRLAAINRADERMESRTSKSTRRLHPPYSGPVAAVCDRRLNVAFPLRGFGGHRPPLPAGASMLANREMRAVRRTLASTLAQNSASDQKRLRRGNGLGHELVEAFAPGQCLECCFLVEIRAYADEEFAAVGFPGGSGWQFLFMGEQFGNMRFDQFAELAVNYGFIVAVAAAEEKTGASSDKALVLVGPFDNFQIASGRRFCGGRSGGGFHDFFSWVAAIARRKSFSW